MLLDLWACVASNFVVPLAISCPCAFIKSALPTAITWARLQIPTLTVPLRVSRSNVIDSGCLILAALRIPGQLFLKLGSLSHSVLTSCPRFLTFASGSVSPLSRMMLIMLSSSTLRLGTLGSGNGNPDRLLVTCIVLCLLSWVADSVCLCLLLRHCLRGSGLWSLALGSPLSFRTIRCFGLQWQTKVASCAESL